MYALQLTQLTKIYPNGVHALQSVDLKVPVGDFFALLGPNGAGKSTLIGIITALVNKSSGQVLVFEYDIDSALMQAKRQIGLVPQEFNFNPFEQVLQIVTNQAGYYGVPRAQALQQAEYYLKALDLWNKRHQPARTLSGGMKRRLMIARALIHQPRLLILDEPTAGVDIELRRGMWDFLKQLNAQGVTIILTTHYLEEAEMLCQHIGILRQGCLIEQSSMQQLLAKLKTETFILELAPCTQPPQLVHYPYRWINSTTVEVEVTHVQGINDLIHQLSQQGITVLSLRNKSNRLEELFIALVGADNNGITQ